MKRPLFILLVLALILALGYKAGQAHFGGSPFGEFVEEEADEYNAVVQYGGVDVQYSGTDVHFSH